MVDAAELVAVGVTKDHEVRDGWVAPVFDARGAEPSHWRRMSGFRGLPHVGRRIEHRSEPSRTPIGLRAGCCGRGGGESCCGGRALPMPGPPRPAARAVQPPGGTPRARCLSGTPDALARPHCPLAANDVGLSEVGLWVLHRSRQLTLHASVLPGDSSRSRDLAGVSRCHPVVGDEVGASCTTERGSPPRCRACCCPQ